MTDTQHPLTETAAAGLWDARLDGSFWHELNPDQRENALTDMRSGWDAAMQERTPARPTEVTDEMVEAARKHIAATEFPHIRDTLNAALSAAATTPTEPLARTLLRVPEGHGAPHHDASAIRSGDYVMQMDKDGTLRGGHAHRQDVDGDWMAEGQTAVTWAALRADRPDALTVWPAPTPPAVEVEMPGEPCVLTDVRLREALVAGVALWTGLEVVVTGFNGRAVVHPISDITAFTLPDGTRARLAGDRENGEPRFVKTQEEA